VSTFSVRARRVESMTYNSRHLLIKVGAPFVFASILCVVFYSIESKNFPKDASPEEWQLFTNRVFHAIRKTDNLSIIVLVVCAHIAHTIMCVPCVHLTQMLCGYCMGFLYASVVCGVSEICIVTVYVLLHVRREVFEDQTLTDLVVYLRKHNLLYIFIFASQMSSMPINSTSHIIGFHDVTMREYLSSHYVVSVINCCKCCFLGYQIRIATEKSTVVLIGYVICIISMLPTIITFSLWYFVIVRFRRNLEANTASNKNTLCLVPGRSSAGRHGASGVLYMGNSVFAQGFVDFFYRPLYKYDEMPATDLHAVAAPLLTQDSLECDVRSGVDSDVVVTHTDCPEHSKNTPRETPVDSPRSSSEQLSGGTCICAYDCVEETPVSARDAEGCTDNRPSVRVDLPAT